VRRYLRLLEQSLPYMSDDEQGQVRQALERYVEDGRGPYRDWLDHLSKGWCRLPELPAAVMKDLLVAWLSPAADGGMVCRQCRLEHPRHKTPPVNEWKLLPGKQHQVGPPPWYDQKAIRRAWLQSQPGPAPTTGGRPVLIFLVLQVLLTARLLQVHNSFG
jgi:hypothetical protein